MLFSLTLGGAERLKTSSCCRRKRISASRETRDPRIHVSSALMNVRTLNIWPRHYPIDRPAPARRRFSVGTDGGNRRYPRVAAQFPGDLPQTLAASSVCRYGRAAAARRLPVSISLRMPIFSGLPSNGEYPAHAYRLAEASLDGACLIWPTWRHVRPVGSGQRQRLGKRG